MRPLDPRLVRHVRAARGYVLLTAGLGLASALAVIAGALLLARALAPVVTGEAGMAEVRPLLAWLAVVLLARAALVGLQERFAHRAAVRVVAELRASVLARAVELGPRWLAQGNASATVTLATRGLDALEPYFVRYLPQLLLAVTVTPAVLAVVTSLDLVAAATIAVTIPLIPIFMVLVGQLTQRYAVERLAAMQRVGAQLLDLLAGLATLKALGRERGPGVRVRELGTAYRRTTMQTLRVAFLSGAVLELLATLSVALVAVGVGLRLVFGEIDLTTGLAVLILAPEVYLPLRQVGAHFHASADGIAAAGRAFAILEERPPPPGRRPAPDLRATVVAWEDVSVQTPGRGTWAPEGLTATVRPGHVLALTGPNGSGKSTAVAVLLGLLRPDRGRVTLRPLDGTGPPADLAEIDPATWWRQVAWVPQRPALLPGTLLENVLGVDVAAGGHEAAAPRGGATAPRGGGAAAQTGGAAGPRGEPEPAVRAAAERTGLDEVVASLPDGWHTRLGHGGAGLSVGQRQRLALTRALLGDAPLVVLDEPTAHLDARSGGRLVALVRALADAGRAVVVIAHRPALLDAADQVVVVGAGEGAPVAAGVAGGAS